jgi:TonB family protein
MKHRYSSLILMAAVCFLACVGHSAAQSAPTPDATPNGVVLTKLSPLIYPRLAQQARIQGDVEVTVSIRQDGSVESSVVARGHPILAPAALESAQKSHFECRGCSEAATSYSMVYTFRLAAEKEDQSDHVIRSGNHVTVVGGLPSFTCVLDSNLRVRAAKCLYLWKCGSR